MSDHRILHLLTHPFPTRRSSERLHNGHLAGGQLYRVREFSLTLGWTAFYAEMFSTVCQKRLAALPASARFQKYWRQATFSQNHRTIELGVEFRADRKSTRLNSSH